MFDSKLCIICGTEFFLHPKHPNRKTCCRKCLCKDYNNKKKEEHKEYYEMNKAKISLKAKVRYQKNRDKILLKSAEYRKNNPEKKKNADRRYYVQNKGKVILTAHKCYERKKNDEDFKKKSKEYGAEYYEKNKDKEDFKKRKKEIRKRTYEKNKEKILPRLIELKHKRRLKLLGVNNPIGISVKTQKYVTQRDKVCVYCNSDKKLTFDHIIPILSENPENITIELNKINNIVLACAYCNQSKKNKDVFEWCASKGRAVPQIVLELLKRQKEQTMLVEVCQCQY